MGPVCIGVEVQRNTDGDTPSNFAAASLQMLFICAAHGLFTCDDRNDIMTLTYFDESSSISKG